MFTAGRFWRRARSRQHHSIYCWQVWRRARSRPISRCLLQAGLAEGEIKANITLLTAGRFGRGRDQGQDHSIYCSQVWTRAISRPSSLYLLLAGLAGGELLAGLAEVEIKANITLFAACRVGQGRDQVQYHSIYCSQVWLRVRSRPISLCLLLAGSDEGEIKASIFMSIAGRFGRGRDQGQYHYVHCWQVRTRARSRPTSLCPLLAGSDEGEIKANITLFTAGRFERGRDQSQRPGVPAGWLRYHLHSDVLHAFHAGRQQGHSAQGTD